jgi:multidrug efflux pump subunit AcrA (membrane-fusion protein)
MALRCNSSPVAAKGHFDQLSRNRLTTSILMHQIVEKHALDDNRGGQLLPGAFTLVHLGLPTVVKSVTVPSRTLLFRKEGSRAVVVRNGHAQLIPVEIGRDYGTNVEIVLGLQPSDGRVS